MGSIGVVAAGHPLTAQAAESVLREGGNAFDAVIAASFVACLAEPVLVSLGGGGYLLARPGEGQPRAYDFFVHTPGRSPCPAGLDFRPVSVDFGTVRQEFHVGLGSMAVPGMVRGLFRVHAELGSVPMRQLVAPAVALAKSGVTLNRFQADILRLCGPIFMATPEARSVFAKSDELLGEGDTLHQPDFANALESLAIEGDDLFYRGEIGARVAALCRDGGCVDRTDLERYEAVPRDPLETRYRGCRVMSMPPPSSGGILNCFAFGLLDVIDDLNQRSFGSFEHMLLVAQVIELTNQARVDALAGDDAACPETERLLDPDLLERYRKEILAVARSHRGTSHINVVDARGNVASLSASNGEGCGHMAPGTGIMLNNMLGEEDLVPQGFHCWRPGQRMTSMMCPTMVEWPRGRMVATGSGGSKRIRTAILQVLINLIDYDMSVEDAVTQPRLFLEDGTLNIEGGFEERHVHRLTERYPSHEIWPDLNLFFGGAHTVERDGKTFHGAGDPRRGGVCVVV